MGLVETSLEVVKLAAKVANPELVQAATKANVEALEVSSKNLELQKQIGELQNEIGQLQGQLKLTGEVFREGDFVFRDGEATGYCSRCWDVDRALVHIVRMHFDKRGMAPGCPQCKTATWGSAQNPRMKET